MLEFVFGLIALLLTPGPTNTLLALGAAQKGLLPSLRYLPGALIAYLLIVTPLASIAGDAMTAHPAASFVIKALAALWVLWLAIRLWLPETGAARAVSAREIFITTLLNPKGLVIGLVLLPHGTLVEILPSLAIFAGLVLAASLAWIAFGAYAIGRVGLFTPQTMRRAGALVLAAFSLLLTSKLIA